MRATSRVGLKIRPPRSLLIAGALCAFSISFAPPARSACNLIPGTEKAFRSAGATVDRPFAVPGEWVTLKLDPACHTGGFTSGDPAAHLVTVVFQAPNGQRNVATLAPSCAAIASLVQACQNRPDVATAVCLDANEGGQPLDVAVPSASELRFRFPDTDAVVLAAADDLTWSGPAAIAVSSALAPELPCALAATGARCATESGLLACVDELYSGEVQGCAAVPDRTFSRFTALPPANDYQAICDDPPSICTGTTDDLRMALDAQGNLLLPMDWRGILAGQAQVPVARLLRGTTSLEAFEGQGQPVEVPGNSFLASFSPEGGTLPPIFDPLADPSSPDLALFGSADAPETVLRIARRSAAFQVCSTTTSRPCNVDLECPMGETCTGSASCVGGSNSGGSCVADQECPGGECGSGIFDFSSRLAVAGAGPVLVRLGACIGGSNALAACASDAQCPGGQCADFSISALDPVPLDGLSQTDELNAFVVSESLANLDLNLDGDQTDAVVRLGDRQTGVLRPIGNAAAPGRAVTRVRKPPFSFPALGVETDVLAFLESEPAEGNCTVAATCDRNSDGDVFDSLLRIFKLSTTMAQEMTAGTNVAIDAEPLVNDASVVVSNGLVFARPAESMSADQLTEHVGLACGALPCSSPSSSSMPALSDDGRYIAFVSPSAGLVPDDTNATDDIFFYDRETATIERVSVSSAEVQANGPSAVPTLSGDGRFIVFVSDASNLVIGDVNGFSDVFLRDRLAGTTEIVSLANGGTGLANGHSSTTNAPIAPAVSDDGRFVAFMSNASNLAATDTDTDGDVFVRDRLTNSSLHVSVDRFGGEPAGGSLQLAMTPDGRFVAFQSSASDLVAGDTNNTGDYFVRDLELATTERVSIDSRGTQSTFGNNATVTSRPGISADGRYVVFQSRATNLVAGDTNDQSDIFLHDRVMRTTVRVSTSSAGTQGSDESNTASISRDGRHIAFMSTAPNLVAGDSNGTLLDAFVADRFTGAVQLVSRSTSGSVANSSSRFGAISGDGRVVAFLSFATNLVGGAGGSRLDVFARATNPIDCASDLTDALECDLSDTVLQVRNSATGSVTGPSCPAGEVRVANGRALFLRPESSGGSTGCPTGVPSLNLDSDQNDDVVHLWSSGTVTNLGVAATAVALSGSTIAALVSEDGQGGSVLNTDGDIDDAVVHVQAVAGASSGGWENVGQAADDVGVVGSIVAFITPEAAQGLLPINDDADVADRVLQIWDAPTSQLIFSAGSSPRAEAAEEFVLGGSPGAELVAFRTPEAAANASLNGDSDQTDRVLQIYDVANQRLINTGAAITPCTFEACDPRAPYKVQRDTVTFLTFEPEQNCTSGPRCIGGATDLNADGDSTDLVLQVFNARLASEQQGGGGGAPLLARAMSGGGTAAFCHALAAVTAGVCSTSGEACVSDASCAGGTCFVPPGGCIRNLGTSCNPLSAGDCGPNSYCEPALGTPGVGTCKSVTGPCQSTSDCTASDVCNNTGQDVQRLTTPLAKPELGGEVFTSGGRCVETLAGSSCVDDEDCESGDTCNTGQCMREHGTCRTNTDCPPSNTCRSDLVVSTAVDSDGDEIPDQFDNCPSVANILQKDIDEDGAGDPCDEAECGNALPEVGEECDDGNASNNDACKTDCTANVCGDGAVRTGVEQCDDGNASSNDACKTDCTPNICGDGAVNTGVEQCDDGNASSNDACKTDCTPNVCGDGAVRTGVEQCDDGNGIPDDGCEPGCTLGVGVNCTPIASAKLTLSKLGGTPNDEGVSFSGKIQFGAGQPAGFSPLNSIGRGAQILIEDLGNGNAPVYELSHRNRPIPPGAKAAVCSPTKQDGWKPNAKLTTYTYTNATNAFPSASCAAGSASGLKTFKLTDKRATSRPSVDVTMKAPKVSIATPIGPLRATVVLSANAADGIAGACGSATFAICIPNASGTTLLCR